MKRNAIAEAARRLVRRLDELGGVSDETGCLTRTFLSPAMARANQVVGGWMREAGLQVGEDAFGNLIGRNPGRADARGTLRLGSHLDTVRNAGRFDGALGVLLPIAALEVLRDEGFDLSFAVEVLGFSEEEGVRFGCGYIGSKGYLGRLRRADLRLLDADGIALGETLAARAKSVPPKTAGSPSLGYIETHIEQGPVLEDLDLAVGVVSAIAGQTRGRMTFVGRAGHAGTVPMRLRRDALAGAAEWIAFAEKRARRHPPLVATVGAVRVSPGAANVIPGEVELSLDVRHPRDPARRAALRAILAGAQAIARRRGLACRWRRTQDDNAVAGDGRLTRALGAAARSVQGGAPALVSGAGHDAVVLSQAMPVAMLFVRCRGGLSHHPDEYASPGDIRTALRVLVRFLLLRSQESA